MKKLILAAALTAAFGAASAQQVTAKTTFDYDWQNGGGHQNEIGLGLSYKLPLGAVDGAVIGNDYGLRGANDGTRGFEVGYSLPVMSMSGFSVTPRVAYGRKNGVEQTLAGFAGNLPYYSLGVDATMPMTNYVRGFVGYRFRNSLNSESYAQHRYSAGVDWMLAPKLTLRAGYAYTIQRGEHFNGITTAVSYAF